MNIIANWKAYLIGLVFLGGIFSAGYWYYMQSQKTIQTLSADNAQLEIYLDQAQESLNTLVAESQRIEAQMLKLQRELQDSEENITELRRILNEHNLTRLALAKPGLIEKRMQDATNEIFNSITTDTKLYRMQSNTE